VAALLALLAACSGLPALDDDSAALLTTTPTTTATGPIEYAIEIVEERPHEPSAFTQGLLAVDGRVFESTGLYGFSTLREVDPTTGAVLRQRSLDADLFGEGLAFHNGRLVQLTWRNKKALVWDANSFELIGEFPYDGEGWGLCLAEDGSHFVQSDGTAFLTRRDVETFESGERIEVLDRGQPVTMLNELECAEGLVWANVWQTPYLAGISPVDGRVVGVADGSALIPAGLRREDVLNGIAHLGPGTWLLTGKRWPKAFVVRLTPTGATFSGRLTTDTSNVTR
jgi:glutamine cyclotransferase